MRFFADPVADLPKNSINPQGFPKERSSRKRKTRSESATPGPAEQGASAAGSDSPSDQPAAKKKRRQSPAGNSQVDPTVQSDEEQPSPLSSIAEVPEGSGTDEEGDAQENNQPADPEEDLYRFENDRMGKDIVRYMRRLDDG
jgi:hypothetical protein